MTAITQNLGSVPVWEGSFTVTDASITATSLVTVQQTSPGGSRADEPTMDPLFCVADPHAGSATVYWTTMGQGPVVGNVRFFYTVS